LTQARLTTPGEQATMARSLSHLKGQTIALLLVIACACHFTLQVTEQYNVPLSGLSLILTVYLGYKGGRWLGFAAGVATTAPWTIRAIFVLRGADRWARLLWGDLRYPLLPGVPLRVEGVSLQFLIQAALLGWFAGWGFNWMESKLSEHQLSLGYLFPGIKQPPPGKPLLQVFYGSLERWMLSIVGEGDSDTRELAGETPRRRKPLLLTAPKLLVLPLLIFLVVCNALIWVSFRFPDLQIAFPPGYLGAVLVLAFSFIAGSTRGIWMGLAVWYISLVQSFAPSFLSSLFSSDLEGVHIRSQVSIESVPQAVGLAILAWWAGKAGEVFRDQEKRRRLGALWTSCKNALPARPRPSFLIFPVFAILTLGIGFSVGSFYLTYHPYVVLFLAGSLFGYYRDPVAVSNRVLVLFLLIATVVQYYSPFPGLTLLMTPDDFYALVLVSVTPLVVGRLELSRSSNCRAAALGFLIALAVRDLFLSNGHFEFSLSGSIFGRSPDFTFYHPLIASWVLHVAIFLVAASFLHWIVCRWPATQPTRV
jgi:hypothetical protein